MNDQQWLSVFRKIGGTMRAGIADFLARDGGTVALGRGAGGDTTYPVDKWAEDIVVAALEDAHSRGACFTLISEELGVREYGVGSRVILVDPIDGSNNAKNGVPFFGFAAALLEGRDLSGLRAGYVVNLAVGDEFWAIKGQGAYKNGARLRTPDTPDVVITAYEATNPGRDLPRILPLLTASKRTRCFGSTALDLAYLAAGAVSVFVTGTASRAFDYAAGKLILEEAGGVVTDIGGKSLANITVGLERTVPLLAAKNAAAHAAALALLKKS